MIGLIASAKGRNSNNSLARELLAKHPELPWPPDARSVGTKIGELDNGKAGWWLKRPEHAKALAELLSVTTVDLGLHIDASGNYYEFKNFPALPPLDLSREAPCPIGNFVPVGDYSGREHKPGFDLAAWATPKTLRQRPPAPRITWLCFPNGSGQDLFWAQLEATSPHDRLRVVSLSHVRTRVRQPQPVIIRVERNEGLADLDVLRGTHPDAAVLIVASHLPETRANAITGEEWSHWEYSAATVDERRRLYLTNPYNLFSGIDRFEWRLVDNWIQKLAKWVEDRLNAANTDTLFSAAAVDEWLENFPFLPNSIATPRDFMAICQICHLTVQKSLPSRQDAESALRVWKSLAPAKPAVQRMLFPLIESRWQDDSVPWTQAITRGEWQRLGGQARPSPTTSDLLAIAGGSNKGSRIEMAKALAEKFSGSDDIDLLLKEGFIIENQAAEYKIFPSFLPDLIARDLLISQIKGQDIEIWAKFLYLKDRRSVIDSALEAFTLDELVSVADKLFKLPSDSHIHMAASEALCVAVARLIDGRRELPEVMVRLLSLVLSRLDVEDMSPRLMTRQFNHEHPREAVNCLITCWSWSTLRKPGKFSVPEHWAWWFPGWVKDWPDYFGFELPFLDEFRPKVSDETPCLHWRELLKCAKRLVDRMARPINNPPDLMKPYLLASGAQGKWVIDPSWWNGVLAHNWAEEALLSMCQGTGTQGAVRLWPTLLDSMDEVRHREDGASIERTLMWRSAVWVWILKSISPKEAVSLPNDAQIQVLYSAPLALPPAARIELIHRLPSDWETASFVVKRVADSINDSDILQLSFLLDSDQAFLVAPRMWDVAPNETERLLRENLAPASEAMLRLIDKCPSEKLDTAIDVLQQHHDAIDAKFIREWVMGRLPDSGSLAGKMLGLI
jgi:hypothetical protein